MMRCWAILAVVLTLPAMQASAKWKPQYAKAWSDAIARQESPRRLAASSATDPSSPSGVAQAQSAYGGDCSERNHSHAPANGEMLGPAVVDDLTHWIVVKAGWTHREAPPLRFVPAHCLVEMFAGKNAFSTSIRIAALYSRRDGVVYLPEDWNPDNLRDRSTLLHELVHHLQALNEVKENCLAAYEPQAHHLTIAWLQELGIEDPYAFLHINEFTIRMISQCPE